MVTSASNARPEYSSEAAVATPCRFLCLEPTTPGGYVRLSSRPNRGKYAHVVEWEEVNGPKPEGNWDIDHLCSNKSCVEITHLELVTRAENVKRAYDRGERPQRKECKNGHEFRPETTRMQYGIYRVCRLCQRDTNRRRRAK